MISAVVVGSELMDISMITSPKTLYAAIFSLRKCDNRKLSEI